MGVQTEKNKAEKISVRTTILEKALVKLQGPYANDEKKKVEYHVIRFCILTPFHYANVS